MLFFKQCPVSYNTPYEKIGDEVRSLADLAPFEIPSSWEWCRVGDLFSNMSGLAYKKDALAIKTDKMVRVLRGGNIGEEQFYFKGDDVFISSELVKPELYLRKNYMITPAVSSLDHIGKIALIDKDYSDTVVGGFVLMLIPHFNDDVVSEYLLYAFAAKHHRDNCRNITHKSGQAFYNLSREQMMNLPVPIPPREEMGRIIAMLKRVLPRVADYAVVDTVLKNLNGSFPEALKKSILQEAVQGKLVPQDPSDEPAEALLERIRAEKQRLIKEGKIKKDKHESVIFRRDNSHYEKLNGIERCIDDEIQFDIPDNWCWCRLGSVVEKLTDGTHKTPKYQPSGVPFLSVKDISSGKISFDDCKYVSQAEHNELYNRCDPKFGDMLLTKVGTTGIPVLINTKIEFSLFVSVALVKFNHQYLYDKYFLYMLQSPLVQKQCAKNTRGVGNKNWVMRDIADTLLVIPPITEQYHIVERIEQLLNVTNRL